MATPYMVRVERGEYGGRFWYEDRYYATMDEAVQAYSEAIQTALDECAKAHGRPITNLYLYDRTLDRPSFEAQCVKRDVVEKAADTGAPVCHAHERKPITPPGWMQIDFPKPDASYANIGVIGGGSCATRHGMGGHIKSYPTDGLPGAQR